MSHRRHSGVFGWVLLILGIVLILNHWYRWHIEWTTILMILGAGIFLAGVINKDRGAVFPGTFFFLLGLFFYFKEHHIFIAPWWDFWPFILMALGIAFVVQFLFDPLRKGGLVPGVILIAIAFWFLFSPWGWENIVFGIAWFGNVWFPALMIICGIYIIIQSVKRHQ
ncbi:hypothetical protein KKA00_10585 [bacterium]|nr:hypothetical protein [bacterium]